MRDCPKSLRSRSAISIAFVASFWLASRAFALAPPVLNAIASPTTSNPVTVVGTAPAGSTVTISVGAEAIVTVSAHPTTGAFSQPTPLYDGVNAISAIATAGGQTSAASNTVSVQYNDTVSRTQSGTISTYKVWTPGTGTPYSVTGDLTIAAGATLVLQPGTTLKFASGKKITVAGNGKLWIRGSAASQAILTSAQATPARGNWAGLVMSAAGAVIDASHAKIEYVTTAIAASGLSTLTLSNSLLREFSSGGVSITSSATGVINGNSFDNGGGSRQGNAVTVTSSIATVVGNEIIRTSRGLNISQASPAVTGNHIEDCATGVHIGHSSSPAIEDNVITANATGVHVEGSSVVATNPQPTFQDNEISANTSYGVFVRYFGNPATWIVDFSQNDWGTEDPAEIAAEIYDRTDLTTSNTPWVRFTPFLDADGTPVTGNYLGGPLSQSTTLGTAAPYDAVGDVYVPPGMTLTIPAGATVRFAPATTLIVDGTATIQGTPGARPLLTSLKASPALGDWEGVLLQAGSSGHVIDRAEIRWATRAIDVRGVLATITNNLIVNFREAGVYLEASAASVGFNEIRQDVPHTSSTTNGVQIQGGNPSIFENWIRKADNGIRAAGTAATPAAPTIAGNLIQESVSAGIYATAYATGTINGGNTIWGGAYGVRLEGNNNVAANPAPLVLANQIYGNSSYNLYTRYFGTTAPAVFDVTLNYWGTTDPIAIAAKIYDHTTESANNHGPFVLFAPFSDASGQAVAGNYLSGPVEVDTTLTATQDYVVTGDIWVKPGVTLTAPAGAVLKFAPVSRLEVDGTLLVQGSVADPAIFTSLSPAPSSGEWNGIYVEASSSGTSIDHAEIRFAHHGVDVRDTNASVSNTLIADFGRAISYNPGAGIYLEDASGSFVDNVIRHDVGHGGFTVIGIGVYRASSPVVDGNWIRGADTGMEITGVSAGAATPTITDNTIELHASGIRVNEYTTATITSGNVITSNGYGVRVEGNGQAAANPAVVVNGNEIYGNTTHNFYAYTFGSPATTTVNAELNYWGTTDSNAIAAKIYDRSDAPTSSAPTVDFTPFLDANGNPIGAATYLNGPIQSSTTLQGGTIYEVVGDVTVPTGLTLTVPAGATLRFAPSAALRVSGTLTVQGTSGSKAIFTSNKATPARGVWEGIVIQAGSTGSTIAHAEIRYATRGIDARNAAVNVSDTLIADFKTTGIYLENASGTIQACTFRQDLAGTATGNGIHVKGGSPTLHANMITEAQHGVFVEGTSANWGSPSITGNTIRENASSGIRLQSYSSPSITASNLITLNDYGLFLLGGGGNPNPIISGNRIHANSLRDLHAQQFGIAEDTLLDVAGNYWGTTDAAAIATQIYDRTDDPTQTPVVDFVPFTDTNGVPVAASQLLVGFITANTTLSGATPYDVVGYLGIRPGATLTLAAGTTLRFVPNSSLEVHGTLLAQGTSGSGVLLTSQKTPKARGDWRGVRVRPGSTGTTLDFTTTEWVYRGIEVIAANVVLRDSTYREFSNAGVYMEASGGTPAGGDLTRLLVDNGNRQGTGLYLSGSSPHVTGSTIRNTQYGVYVLAAAAPLIDAGNVITANTYGVFIQGNSQAAGNPQPIVRRNDIHANVTANLALSQIHNPGGSFALDARENWWGSTVLASIATKIQTVNVPIGSVAPNVDFSNFLNAAGGMPIVATYQTFVLAGVSQSATVFEPLTQSPVEVAFTIGAPVTVTLVLCIESDATCVTPVRSIPVVFASPGPKTIAWDGKNASGNFVAPEAYSYKLVATDGVADGVNEATYDPARAGSGTVFDNGTPSPSFNTFRNEYWKTTVTLSQPNRLSLMIGTTYVWEDRPYPAGESLVVWDGRDAAGALRSGSTPVYFFLKTKIKSNAFLVRRTVPSITGLGTAPNVEVQSDPYFVWHSYEQLSRIAYRIDQNATVVVKLLPPGVVDPADPSAIVVQAPALKSTFGSGGVPNDHIAEWTGYASGDTNAIQTADEGTFTFVIQATSAQSGLTTTYRGALQARQ